MLEVVVQEITYRCFGMTERRVAMTERCVLMMMCTRDKAMRSHLKGVWSGCLGDDKRICSHD